MLTDECAVWWAHVDDARPWHLRLLDDDERTRRSTLRQQADRDRFVLGAVLLRLIVGHLLDRPPADVEVARTCPTCGHPHGRPRLHDALHVSVSHSGELVVVALTGAGQVGVDVERVVDVDVASLLDTVSSPEERHDLSTTEDFFTLWTRKESVLKATGEGLARPMSEVVVSGPAEPPRLLRLGSLAYPAASLWDLSPVPGYAAALAVLGSVRTLRQHDASSLVRGEPGTDTQAGQEAADTAGFSLRRDQARRP